MVDLHDVVDVLFSAFVYGMTFLILECLALALLEFFLYLFPRFKDSRYDPADNHESRHDTTEFINED